MNNRRFPVQGRLDRRRLLAAGGAALLVAGIDGCSVGRAQANMHAAIDGDADRVGDDALGTAAPGCCRMNGAVS